jgi:hypothetical protein
MSGLVALLKTYEDNFKSRFPAFKIVLMAMENHGEKEQYLIHCTWEQYTIPRVMVLVYDIKNGQVDFNPFASEPRPQAKGESGSSEGIDWIHMYVIEKFPGLYLFERLITIYVRGDGAYYTGDSC